MSDLVVSADWLADRLDSVAVVDVRDTWEYDGIGHVPGAINVPFDSFRSEKGDEGMLPGADRWADLLGSVGVSATDHRERADGSSNERSESDGVSADDTIVAYDDHHGVFAARFLVTALLYGHRDLHLLDGDYSAWTREHPVSTDAPDREPTTYEVREPEHSPLISMAEVEAAIDADAVLVDTRSPEEFADGHIPGAVNLDWVELVDDETRGLKPRDELEAVLAEHGVTPDRRVVLYCNTARRISHTYVVLRWLGYENVEFYEGSLTEWVEKGGEVVEA
jgi:thiosulfate/3-mercaptopyruvate sulfurtransferase